MLLVYTQLIAFIVLVIAATPLLGRYMARVFQGERTFAHPALSWLERLTYRIAGVDSEHEMSWWEYLKALFYLNALGFVAVFLLQMMQAWLPLNPQSFSAVPWTLAFNTAASFVTNTNWQAYAGETTLSYTTQMVGLAVQNFLSAATGNAVLLALIRGLTRKQSETIGNFYVDFVRTIVYLLIPLSLLMALFLVSQGVVQTFSPYAEVTTLENAKQTIALGPVASQVAIKQLGSNGGGFFSANSAHPFENPTGLSNLMQMVAILLIPAASVYMYGVLIGSKKHARLLFVLMGIFWIGGIAISLYSEQLHPSMEGKETRLGAANSIFWSVSTTATSNGSVNGMLDSLSPLAGGTGLFNMMLGELVYGGVGVGLCSMLMFVLLTVFLAGLMVGRTPEYLGKKIEKTEVQWVTVAVLTPTALILIGAGFSIIYPEALSSLANHGPHGLSEMLYAFTSAAANNGSAFAGLNVNTIYFNLALGLVMLIARSAILVSTLALAGLLSKKRSSPHTIGTFTTDNWLFAVLLFSVILIVGTLSFFPALALGPGVEHLLMLENRTF